MTQPSETVKEKLTTCINSEWSRTELPRGPFNNPSQRREFEYKLELLRSRFLYYFKFMELLGKIIDFEVINCYREDTALFNEGYFFRMSWTESGNPYVGHYLALMNSGDILDIDLLKGGESRKRECNQLIKGILF
jgi:hypothetical protein